MENKTELKNTKSSPEIIFIRTALKSFLKKWRRILMVVIFSGILGVVGTVILVRPTYQSSFAAYINNNLENHSSDSLTTSDISAARDLTSTYSTIIMSQIGVEKAIEESQLDMTYKEALKCISVKSVNNTEIIEVSVVTTNSDDSYRLAAALEKIAPGYVKKIVTGSSMTIITPANSSVSKVGPNYMRNGVMAALLGGIIFLAYLLIAELADNRITDVEELTQYGIPVIGTIHDMDTKKQNKR